MWLGLRVGLGVTLIQLNMDTQDMSLAKNGLVLISRVLPAVPCRQDFGCLGKKTLKPTLSSILGSSLNSGEPIETPNTSKYHDPC